MKRFTVPHVHFDVEVEIFDEPLMLLEQFFNNQKQGISLAKKMEKGKTLLCCHFTHTQKPKENMLQKNQGLTNLTLVVEEEIL